MADDSSIINQINQTAKQGSTGGQPAGSADAFNAGLTANAASIANGASSMLAEAHSGALVYDAHTGQSLLNRINNAIQDLGSHDLDLGRIAKPSKLGMTAGGLAMAKFNHEVTTSGPKAFIPAHIQFVQSLRTARDAIKIAMDNYDRTERDNTQSFKAKD
jgi:hypothetical protein